MERKSRKKERRGNGMKWTEKKTKEGETRERNDSVLMGRTEKGREKNILKENKEEGRGRKRGEKT